jgi:hypothetical protein
MSRERENAPAQAFADVVIGAGVLLVHTHTHACEQLRCQVFVITRYHSFREFLQLPWIQVIRPKPLFVFKPFQSKRVYDVCSMQMRVRVVADSHENPISHLWDPPLPRVCSPTNVQLLL